MQFLFDNILKNSTSRPLNQNRDLPDEFSFERCIIFRGKNPPLHSRNQRLGIQLMKWRRDGPDFFFRTLCTRVSDILYTAHNTSPHKPQIPQRKRSILQDNKAKIRTRKSLIRLQAAIIPCDRHPRERTSRPPWTCTFSATLFDSWAGGRDVGGRAEMLSAHDTKAFTGDKLNVINSGGKTASKSGRVLLLSCV